VLKQHFTNLFIKGIIMRKIKTVFKEEIVAGDKIMYIYKASGITHICFGEVLDIEYKNVKCVTGEQPHLHVHKVGEMWDGRRFESCDKKVILTSPLAFKCNQPLPFLEGEPKDES
jgi:hypothetical protein